VNASADSRAAGAAAFCQEDAMSEVMESKFAKLGARLKVHEVKSVRRHTAGRFLRPLLAEGAPLRVDVREDGQGEYFHLDRRQDVSVKVVDVRPADRHLLLVARIPQDGDGAVREAAFLCGRDERHWFVAAIPESAGAYDVQGAKDALKPQEVWDAMNEFGVPMSQRNQRRTAAFVRQGEWFFIPRPKFKVNEKHVLRKEPIRRGAGKPHTCQFLFRIDGELVWVCDAHPNGLTDHEVRRFTREQWSRHRWRRMVRNARVYVKGNIRHPDHKTVWLGGWHEVVMNRETEAQAMQDVAFLD
jgi:hypothetical protein